jgi:homoaconitase/3-isopropylmalate dehydratase large subunit
MVEKQAKEEGLATILEDAGFNLREPDALLALP